jgi:hypothetical protein
LFVDGATRPNTVRSENWPAADRIRSTGVRFSGHPERRIFPPHGSKRFGIDLSAIKPLAGCLNAAEPESKTVNVT